ncbi:MAG TPA: tyrosine-type recombinase/integrase, partial [Nakamurella sp.]|nr:tyrosine-type recombinase/integrase [Nakamurella sp.]
VPLHAELRTALRAWAYTERPTWPVASDTPALLLNRRGGRLSDRSARAVIDELIASAKLAENPGTGYGPHALRHTFATQLEVRGIASDASFDGYGDRDLLRDLGFRVLSAIA